MFCNKCGTEVSENAVKCPNCGADLTEIVIINESQTEISEDPALEDVIQDVVLEDSIQQDEITEDPNEGKKWKKLLVFFVIFIALAGSGVLAFLWYSSPKQKMKRALEEGDYEAVKEIIKEDREIVNSTSVVEYFSKKIQEIREDYKSKNIDYAQATNDLDSIQSIQVDGVQAELNEAFSYLNRINESRISFDTAESFMEKKDYPNAILQYKKVIEEDENYSQAGARLLQAVNSYREEQMVKAKEKADQEEYQGAVDILQMALTVLPNDAEITQQITLYQADIVTKIKKDTLKSAEEKAQQKQFLEAMRELEQYLESNPSDADVKAARQQYYDLYIADAISRAEEYAVAENYQGAISIINAALKDFPEDNQLNQKLVDYQNDQVEKNKRELLNSAEELAQKQQFIEAMSLLENYLTSNPSDIDVKTAWQSCYDRYVDDVIAKADALLGGGAYVDAISEVEKGLINLPDEQKFAVKKVELVEAHVQSFLIESQNKANSGDFIGGVAILEEGLKQYANETRFTEGIASIQEQHINKILSDADNLLKSNDISGAIEVVRSGQTYYPDDARLSEKIKEINAKKPVSLIKMKAFNGWLPANNGTPTDPFGNNYASDGDFVTFGDNISRSDFDYETQTSSGRSAKGVYKEVYLNRKYGKLTGLLAPHYEITEKGFGWIEIQDQDGKILYTSPTIYRKTQPFEFSVDVSNVEYLKITVWVDGYWDWGSFEPTGYLILSNFLLYPN